MGRGKRYDGDAKLNLKKVFGVIITLVLIILSVLFIKNLINEPKKEKEKYVESAYFTLYKNNKWGVIDSKGKIVIEPTYSDVILIPDNTKPIFVVTMNENYNENTFTSKVVNEKNKVLFDQYSEIKPIMSVNESGVLTYEKNVLIAKLNEKYGLIDFTGKKILDFEYEEIKGLDNVTNSIITKKDGKYGLVTTTGEKTIDNKYLEIKPLTDNYRDGYIVKNEESKFGIIGYMKTVILGEKYQEIKKVTGSQLYVAKINNSWKLMDSNEAELLELKTDEVLHINNSELIVKRGNKVGVINKLGEEIIKFEYENIKPAFLDKYIVYKNGKYGLMNSKSESILDIKYTNINYRKDIEILEVENENFESDIYNSNIELKITGIITNVNTEKGYIRVKEKEDFKYYNLKLEEKTQKEVLLNSTMFLSKKDGKYGYLNKDGKVIVEYLFDDAMEQNNYGFSAVKKNNFWGVIDANGNVVIEPKYNLDDNILIDFMGEYYLGADLNMNYYTDKK